MEKHRERQEEQQRKEERARERVVAQEQRRLDAAGSVAVVMEIVRRAGWVMGGRGKLTAGMLKDVIIAKGERVAQGEKAADLIARVQVLLSWSEQAGFAGFPPPGDSAAQPQPPLPQ
jgi:hypothetical protein